MTLLYNFVLYSPQERIYYGSYLTREEALEAVENLRLTLGSSRPELITLQLIEYIPSITEISLKGEEDDE